MLKILQSRHDFQMDKILLKSDKELKYIKSLQLKRKPDLDEHIDKRMERTLRLMLTGKGRNGTRRLGA